MKMQIAFLILLTGIVHAETGRPEDISEAGHMQIDGRLNDWSKIKWTPLTGTLAGNPVHISNAQWTLRWDDDARLYIAVRYDDADLVLQNSYVNSTAQDCVEIYVRGDTGSKPVNYSKSQESAQHYFFGLSKDRVTAWKQLAAETCFPAHNPAKVSVRLDGNTFTYEIMVSLYDKFSVTSRRDCEMTEPYPELEIGVDIAIVDAGKNGFAGIRSENTLDNKADNAGHIAEHTLSE